MILIVRCWWLVLVLVVCIWCCGWLKVDVRYVLLKLVGLFGWFLGVMVGRCCLVGLVICCCWRLILVMKVYVVFGMVCFGWLVRCVSCCSDMVLIVIIGLVIYGW